MYEEYFTEFINKHGDIWIIIYQILTCLILIQIINSEK